MALRSFQAAVFLSAFLLFLLEPMVGKALLPEFGGSYLVWGTCMAVFQGLLVLGYAWAHTSQSRWGVRRYAPWHLGLFLVPLVMLALSGPPAVSTGDSGLPVFVQVTIRVLLLVGVPFFVLSTQSVILQSWLACSDLPQRERPTVLYAASNAGSLLGLLAFPFVVEPWLPLDAQRRVWYALFVALGLMQVTCLRHVVGGTAGASTPEGASGGLGRWKRVMWLGAAASAFLLAVTNAITFDIASAPFLWVLPLCVYLLTFVFLFRTNPWYPDWLREGGHWAWAVALIMQVAAPAVRLVAPPWLLLLVHLVVLFVVCMNAHGRVADLKPSRAGDIPVFYLALSVGGFLGSAMVSWVAPLVSRSAVEYFWALLAVVAGLSDFRRWREALRWELGLAAGLLVVALAIVPMVAGRDVALVAIVLHTFIAFSLLLAFVMTRRRPLQAMALVALVLVLSPIPERVILAQHVVHKERNFYGVYTVYDSAGIRYLLHGTTRHGMQRVGPGASPEAISYYRPQAPCPEILRADDFSFHEIGMIGLGTGAVASWLRDGQHLRIFELDPANGPIAEKYFTYLEMGRKKGATIDFVYGDGRLKLAGERDGAFDLLILDAFSSDAIPVHLLTVEAMREYLRVLKPGGLLLMHVSNRNLDLRPQVESQARELGLWAWFKSNQAEADAAMEKADELTAQLSRTTDPAVQARLKARIARLDEVTATLWMAVAPSREVQSRLFLHGWDPPEEEGLDPPPNPTHLPPWTDQYSNLLRILKFRSL